jgi:hypothetical protein
MSKQNDETQQLRGTSSSPTQFEWQSEMMVKNILRKLHPDASSTQLYESAAKVAASARQAAAYEASSNHVALTIQPLLRYYTVLHWMKTLLFVKDLSFPSSSSVLQHGISVRRSKRHPYRWPYETAYVYKDGVLQSVCALACPNIRLPSRFVVGDLLGTLPHIARHLSSVYERFQHVYIIQSAGNDAPGSEYVARKIASNADLTVDQWRSKYLEVIPGFARAAETTEALSQDHPPSLVRLPAPSHGHPWTVSDGSRRYMLDDSWYPQWICHFVLLYTLSALSRYNPVEWSDVVTWNNEPDAFFVREYLSKYPIEHITQLLFAAFDLRDL